MRLVDAKVGEQEPCSDNPLKQLSLVLRRTKREARVCEPELKWMVTQNVTERRRGHGN